MSTYSDRDYFDDKFAEISDRFIRLEHKLDKIHLCLYGNGNLGITEKVRRNEGKIKMIIIIIIGLLPIQIKESRDVILGILKALLGL